MSKHIIAKGTHDNTISISLDDNTFSLGIRKLNLFIGAVREYGIDAVEAQIRTILDLPAMPAPAPAPAPVPSRKPSERSGVAIPVADPAPAPAPAPAPTRSKVAKAQSTPRPTAKPDHVVAVSAADGLATPETRAMAKELGITGYNLPKRKEAELMAKVEAALLATPKAKPAKPAKQSRKATVVAPTTSPRDVVETFTRNNVQYTLYRDGSWVSVPVKNVRSAA